MRLRVEVQWDIKRRPAETNVAKELTAPDAKCASMYTWYSTSLPPPLSARVWPWRAAGVLDHGGRGSMATLQRTNIHTDR